MDTNIDFNTQRTLDLVLGVLKEFSNFSGRTGRREFWTYAVVLMLVSAVVFTIGYGILGTTLFSNVLALITLIPNIAVGVRRMHDIGRPGFFVLLNLLPIIGWIGFVYLAIQPSVPGANEYGPPPVPKSAS